MVFAPSLKIHYKTGLHMTDTDDDLMFLDDPEDACLPSGAPWVVLVVDDDRDVHAVTKIAFNGQDCEGRSIDIHSAYSGQDAIEQISQVGSTLPALVLMDMVMDTPTDGLDTIHRLRNELQLRDIPTIFIRTGQPGLTHSLQQLQNDPDIDLVLLKSDLTAEVLRREVFRALRNGRKAFAK